MKIFILRHGETEWNKVKRIQGFTDIPLDEKGIELARLTGIAMGKAGIHFQECVSSPLSRARQTAELVLAGQTVSGIPVRTDARIEEINLGVWEGKCMTADPRFTQVDPGAQTFFQHPEEYRAPEGAETYEQVIARTGDFLKETAERYAGYEGKDFNLLVSSHGCASRALLMNIDPLPLKDYWRGQIPKNCTVSIAELSGRRWRLLEQDVQFARL